MIGLVEGSARPPCGIGRRPGARRLLRGALLAAIAMPLLAGGAARGQDKPAWFVPPAAKAPADGAPARRPARPAPVAGPASGPAAAPVPGQAAPEADEQADAVPQYSLPALAPLPSLPKTGGPPTAVIGVLGVPDVMRASSASQMVQKVVGARRDKLAADYQKEQQVWRDMQQSLQAAVNSHNLSQDQLQAREAALQARVTSATREFRARNKVIQEAAQISLAQVERVLVAVIRQVADSRGINLVLHRQQVALNIADFDITDQVTAQLNTLLPSVVIPPDGQEPTPANTGGALVAGQQPTMVPAGQ